MVDEQLAARGITDPHVLAAMRKIPRHLFVAQTHAHLAYRDGPLPIGYGQTISQPYMVAVMTQLLAVKRSDRVLEIGTGSGYQAAVLSQIASEVISVERHVALTEYARDNLRSGPRIFGAALTSGLTVDQVEAWPDLVEAVTVEDVTAAAAHVLDIRRSVTSILLPKPTG